MPGGQEGRGNTVIDGDDLLEKKITQLLAAIWLPSGLRPVDSSADVGFEFGPNSRIR